MHKFQFRLETLLKFRKMKEDQALVLFAEATKKLQEAELKLQTINEQKNQAIHYYRTCQQKVLTVEMLKLVRNYVDKLDRDLQWQQEQLEQAVIWRKECMQQLEDAMKQRKLIDKLKNRLPKNFKIDMFLNVISVILIILILIILMFVIKGTI